MRFAVLGSHVPHAGTIRVTRALIRVLLGALHLALGTVPPAHCALRGAVLLSPQKVACLCALAFDSVEHAAV